MEIGTDKRRDMVVLLLSEQSNLEQVALTIDFGGHATLDVVHS